MRKIDLFFCLSMVCLFSFVDGSCAFANAGTASQSPSNSAEDRQIQLSLQDALFYTLEGNRDIKVAIISPKIAQAQLLKAEAVYDPALFASGGANKVDRPTESILDTGSTVEDALQEDRWSAQVGLKQHVFTGGSLSFYQEIDYLKSNSEYVMPNPQNRSHLTWQFAQPLLRGIGDKENRAAIQIANTNVNVSNEEYRQKVMDVVNDLVNAYWQSYFAREVNRLSRESLKMAEEILRRETVRYGRGIAKQLDVERATAAIETRKNTLSKTESEFDSSINTLKFLMNSPDLQVDDPAGALVPVEDPSVEFIEFDPAQELSFALENNPELILAKQQVKISKTKMDLAKHMKLPKLDAKLDYTLNSLDKEEGAALEEAYKSERASWSVLLEFEMPFCNAGADAEYKRLQLEYEQALQNLRKVNDQIKTQIYTSMRELAHGQEQVKTSERSLAASQKVLDSEEARYELAQSTNEDLLQSQEQVIAAQKEYLRSKVNHKIQFAKFSRVKGSLLANYNIKLK